MDAEDKIRLALARFLPDEEVNNLLEEYFRNRLQTLSESRDSATAISASTLLKEEKNEMSL